MKIPSRFFLLASISFTVFAVANAQSGRVQPTPTPMPDDTVRVVTEEIKLNVLAFDEKGEFFRDVTENDIVISENDILHQPASVRRLPANVLIVMDTGGDMRVRKSLEQTRKVAGNLIQSLRPGDNVAVMYYADKPELVGEWTDDKAQMLAAIKRSDFGRRSAFSDAVTFATDFMTRSGRENKHVVMITDGIDTLRPASVKFDALQRLLATDISVHIISYTALEAASMEDRTKRTSNTPPRHAMPDEVKDQLPKGGVQEAAKMPKIGPTINMDRSMIRKIKARQADLEATQVQLEKLAENTNGEFILPVTLEEMTEKAALVARMIDSSYVVTYIPKLSVVDTRGLAERNILVTSKRPGLVVQARRKLLIHNGR